jgi:hypothetical protein
MGKLDKLRQERLNRLSAYVRGQRDTATDDKVKTVLTNVLAWVILIEEGN